MSITRWKVKEVKLSGVKEMPGNPRAISGKALDGLKQSLTRFGYVEPIIWNERTGHIVGGHQRFFALIEAGIEKANMVVVDMSPEEEMTANLALNNPEIEGNWTEGAVDLLYQLELADSTLFNSLNMEALRSSLEKTPSMKERVEGGTEEDYDTECPCCGHKWNIQAEDVAIGR